MATDLVKLSKDLGLGELVVKQLTQTQLGWLNLELTKRKTFESLANSELVVQGFLNSITTEEDHNKCKDRIKQANVAYEEMKQRRLHFTNTLKEKLVTPAMEYEKRCDPLFEKAKDRELQLRKIAEEKAKEANAKTLEEQAFTAHFTNENFRIAAAYRMSLQKLITEFYTRALTATMPVAKLKAYKQQIATALRSEKTLEAAKFERKLIENDRAIELFEEIRKYDKEKDLQDAISSIEQKFSMYGQDLANKEAAILAANKEQTDKEQETQRKLVIETSTNNLAANSITETMANAPIVRRSVAVVEENTDGWALAIVSHFVANWHECKKYLGVKTWAKLSLAQMAVSLGKLATETGQQYENLQFKDVEK